MSRTPSPSNPDSCLPVPLCTSSDNRKKLYSQALGEIEKPARSLPVFPPLLQFDNKDTTQSQSLLAFHGFHESLWNQPTTLPAGRTEYGDVSLCPDAALGAIGKCSVTNRSTICKTPVHGCDLQYV